MRRAGAAALLVLLAFGLGVWTGARPAGGLAARVAATWPGADVVWLGVPPSDGALRPGDVAALNAALLPGPGRAASPRPGRSSWRACPAVVP